MCRAGGTLGYSDDLTAEEAYGKDRKTKTKKVKKYYIANGYVGNAVMWWPESNAGYTSEFNEAREFTEDEAKKLIESEKGYQAWPVDYIKGNQKCFKTIVDMQYLDASNLLKTKSK